MPSPSVWFELALTSVLDDDVEVLRGLARSARNQRLVARDEPWPPKVESAHMGGTRPDAAARGERRHVWVSDAHASRGATRPEPKFWAAIDGLVVGRVVHQDDDVTRAHPREAGFPTTGGLIEKEEDADFGGQPPEELQIGLVTLGDHLPLRVRRRESVPVCHAMLGEQGRHDVHRALVLKHAALSSMA